MKKRILIDMGMVLLLPLLMAYSMVGELLHEIIGVTMFILFISHHIMNRSFLLSLKKGSWNPLRIANTVLDAAMLVLMLIMMASAPTISRYVFSFLNIGGAALGRMLHLVGANWLFVLMSVHLGLHVRSVAAWIGITKNRKLCRILGILFAGIAVYGGYAFVKRGVFAYMTMTQMYASFDLSEPTALFVLDYLTIMDLFAVIGFLLGQALIRIGKRGAEAGSDTEQAVPGKGRRKKLGIVAGVLGVIILVGGIVWGIPYMRRHFVSVEIDRKAATTLDKVQLPGETLVVYFTRTGNSAFKKNVDAVSSASLMRDEKGRLVGNSELLAEMVQSATGADLYPIRVRKQYPSTYGGTVGVAGKELRRKGFPELDTSTPIPNAGEYDRVILVFPLWWGTVPKAVEGCIAQMDLENKDVYLILTHGGGNAGSVPKDLPPMLRGGRLDENILLIYDDDADEAGDQVREWLTTITR